MTILTSREALLTLLVANALPVGFALVEWAVSRDSDEALAAFAGLHVIQFAIVAISALVVAVTGGDTCRERPRS